MREEDWLVWKAAREMLENWPGLRIEMVKRLDEKSFFDGLLDTMIEYNKKHGALASLSKSHREYVDDDTKGTDGKEAT